ncbi:PAC2 family protein [Curtobacterium flaccumfaciens pv. flaccumfaciens]|jgi:PAC2 family|uniref:proteasome assembly chaperone family protein n=1 Tax=Curtobacterium flaccumfaciens TaxID=2035 RepID=UPI001ADB3350|nr:PAC2 family protein [Curtobacterium flaccumfaciens]MBO9047505.1 PAC2 family protein [Curtobacterium flaccumfaciens pv. flaccumfaciens]MBO9058476.1 PAC2 family protein [Curtobacterium flaccumfaciens pv. flaccumfaciens]QTR92348.1 PAC2 family protein [Curtobacterium flaccumfaciens pv. flaccumfaciens]QVG67647.1 PAC2 family protein [Curtobacterium flaccumfaciens pv. flaccumfaciens]
MGTVNHPEELYTFDADAPTVPAGLHLIAGLTGFADAGSAVAQVTNSILEDLDTELVAEFDPDVLLDWRARRPVITFEHDHISAVEPPRLALHLVRDEIGQPFLFLSGYEPDFQWNRFVRAVTGLAADLQVADTTWVQSIPMPVPHTRPISLTVSGTRADLVEQMSVWKPETQAPANVLHLVEHRLAETGAQVTGLVLLVPHYLSDTEFPDAAVAALSGIAAATGLIFPTDALRESGREFLTRVEEQVAGNPELQRLVSVLEERHDTYMEGNPVASPLTGVDGEVPTADAIAAELERFLADRRTQGDTTD